MFKIPFAILYKIPFTVSLKAAVFNKEVFVTVSHNRQDGTEAAIVYQGDPVFHIKIESTPKTDVPSGYNQRFDQRAGRRRVHFDRRPIRSDVSIGGPLWRSSPRTSLKN